MDETYSKSIDNCLTLLIEQLGCPDSLIIWLKVRKILNVADCKLITKPTTNEAKFHRLLDILKLKPDGWDGLINYLIDHNMKWIADRLLSNWKVKISEGQLMQMSSGVVNDSMQKVPAFLVACGCFNPPTFMHLRLFERARDFLQLKGIEVNGGIISPTSDGYQEKTSKPISISQHRVQMCKLAVKTSDWISVNDWEASQPEWSRTVSVLRQLRSTLASQLTMMPPAGQPVYDNLAPKPEWPVRLFLLCGADLLESFAVPNLWQQQDIEEICRDFGLVVISREGYNPEKFIYENDLLSRYQSQIHLVTEWISNDISSTKIRRALNRGESVKYLLDDSVIDYIYKNRLYGVNPNTTGPSGKHPRIRPPVPQLKPIIKSTFRDLATEQKSRKPTSEHNIADLKVEKVSMAKLTSLDHGSDKNSGEKPNLTIQVYTEEPAKLYRIPKKTDSMPIGQTQLDSITSYQQPSELQKHLIADLKSALNCTSAATSHKETAKKTQNCAEVNLRGFSEPPAVHIVNSRIFASHVRPPKPAKIAQERPLSYHGNEEVPDNKTNSEIDYSTAWEQPTVPIIYPGTFVRSQSLTSLKRNSNGWQISDAPETTV